MRRLGGDQHVRDDGWYRAVAEILGAGDADEVRLWLLDRHDHMRDIRFLQPLVEPQLKQGQIQDVQVFPGWNCPELR